MTKVLHIYPKGQPLIARYVRLLTEAVGPQMDLRTVEQSAEAQVMCNEWQPDIVHFHGDTSMRKGEFRRIVSPCGMDVNIDECYTIIARSTIEAEHFYSTSSSDGTQWSVYPDYGRTRSAVALTPYTKPVGDAKLNYRFSLPEGVKQVKVHVIVKSTLDFLNVGGFEYTVSIDGQQPQTVNFNKTLVDRQPYMYSEYYPAVARRIVEKVVELPVGNADVHELTLSPRHPGIVFEKIVIDFGGYKPSYLFGNESPFTK